VATIDGKMVELSARELGLLEVLLQRAGRLVSKDQLVERLCEWGEEVSNNAIEVYIHRLRKKIEQGRSASPPCAAWATAWKNPLIGLQPASHLRKQLFIQKHWRETLSAQQRSLFGEILDWMLTPLLLLWPVSLALTWLVAQGLANKPFDRALETTPRRWPSCASSPTTACSSTCRSRPASCCAPTIRQRLLPGAGPGGAFSPASATCRRRPTRRRATGATAAEPRLRDAEYQGVPVRVAYIWVPLPGLPGPALVQVAETREKRSVLATEIIKGVMLPQFVILPLAVLLVWLALARGIKPLSSWSGASARAARRPLAAGRARRAAGGGPLVASVNDLLTRLKDSIATQKRFLADAAHQLKTPLAGLRMQADLAQREGTSEAELKRSLQQIGRSSMRATHTVNQLLALARAEGSSAALPASAATWR
jgi:two-component system sensor histidine kinase TctE